MLLKESEKNKLERRKWWSLIEKMDELRVSDASPSNDRHLLWFSPYRYRIFRVETVLQMSDGLGRTGKSYENTDIIALCGRDFFVPGIYVFKKAPVGLRG